jgi:hypothetical protein
MCAGVVPQRHPITLIRFSSGKTFICSKLVPPLQVVARVKKVVARVTKHRTQSIRAKLDFQLSPNQNSFLAIIAEDKYCSMNYI